MINRTVSLEFYIDFLRVSDPSHRHSLIYYEQKKPLNGAIQKLIDCGRDNEERRRKQMNHLSTTIN